MDPARKYWGGCNYVIRGAEGRERASPVGACERYATTDDHRRPKLRADGRSKFLGKTMFSKHSLDIKQLIYTSKKCRI